MEKINVGITEEVAKQVEVTVDLNSAQDAKDAADRAEQALSEIGQLLSGKENLSNKKTSILENEESDSFYGSIKAWVTYLKERYAKIKKAIIANPTISYTFKLSDADNGLVVHSSSSAITEIIPNNSSAPFPVGTVLESISTGTGVKTTTGASGVTIQTNVPVSSSRYEKRTFTKIDTNTWIMSGNSVSNVKRKYYLEFTLGQTFAQSTSWYGWAPSTTAGNVYTKTMTVTTAVDTDGFSAHNRFSNHLVSTLNGYVTNVYHSFWSNNGEFAADLAIGLRRIVGVTQTSKTLAKKNFPTANGSQYSSPTAFDPSMIDSTYLINVLDQLRVFVRNNKTGSDTLNMLEGTIIVEITES